MPFMIIANHILGTQTHDSSQPHSHLAMVTPLTATYPLLLRLTMDTLAASCLFPNALGQLGIHISTIGSSSQVVGQTESVGR